ncbi:MAG: DUF4838 domain-containing protein [Ruminococcaceae bacterium]|nr:DUF4838 domain-containing protein [Oscillospiraceae bacterium]
MFVINKISSYSVVDYAAEELRKYLRMMMPECGKVEIKYEPYAKDGFRLGLMQDFGLDVSDAEEPELDDILYIDTDTDGGIIAGDNPRSILLAVYEFFRQNGCRWLMPGVDGEYIPTKDIVPVKYRFKPSCRYRGQCNEGAEFQSDMIEAIEFAPKVGMNVFMMEFVVPSYYRSYYRHTYNEENRKPEPVSDRQIVQWKRQCESEIEKRGLQFHDIGHGFAASPFGMEDIAESGDFEKLVNDENRQFMAMINGERKLFNNAPYMTQFCMSNPKAQKMVSDFVVDYAYNHSNSDYLHVWLADSKGNHCECEECQKKTPSDWYTILLNMIDEKLTEKKLDTRIVFIAYCDTIFAPLEEKIKNPNRFTMLFAPIHRSYAVSLPAGEPEKPLKYVRNQNSYPNNLAWSFEYLKEWKKMWQGACVAYEYHFWRHQTYDISGLEIARRAHEDVKIYKERGVNGVIEDGSQRSFFPNGFAVYTYARTLFDTSLSYEEILEDYFSYAYGEDWRKFYDYLLKINDALPFDYFSWDMAKKRDALYCVPEQVDKIAKIREITKEGRELMRECYDSDYRSVTFAVRLLEHHADFCDLISDWMLAKANGDDEKGSELYDKARVEFGKREAEIQTYYDHHMFFGSYFYVNRVKRAQQQQTLFRI